MQNKQKLTKTKQKEANKKQQKATIFCSQKLLRE